MKTHPSAIASKSYLTVIIITLLILLIDSCSEPSGFDEGDFSYYEPIIGEEFNVNVDYTRKVDFEYNTEIGVIAKTEDAMGYKYTIEIPAAANSLDYSGVYDGYIAPLSAIDNLPSDVKFLFGVEIEPAGVTFVKPVEITVELPGSFDIKDLRGFYSRGGGDWAYLEPIRIEKSSDVIKAIFKVMHFSSYGGISANDSYFNCPDVRSAQTCDDLKEVIACNLGHYEIGINEELNQQDKNLVNKLLKTWMEYQLKYAAQEQMDYTDIYEFKYELSQYICWKAMTQEFNSNPELVFADTYRQAEDLIMEGFASVMNELNAECLEYKNKTDGECHSGTVTARTVDYLNWFALAQLLGIEDDPSIIGLFDFCDGAVSNTIKDFKIIGPVSGSGLVIFDGINSYDITLNGSGHIIPVGYSIINMIDDLMEINESDIKWIDRGDFGNQVANAIIYNNGAISLNSGNPTVSGMLLCNTSDCQRTIYTVYDLYLGSCYLATVSLRWHN